LAAKKQSSLFVESLSDKEKKYNNGTYKAVFRREGSFEGELLG
jgi:hypothetical protein